MKQTITKKLIPWVTVIALFIFGFYLSSQRNTPSVTLVVQQNDYAEYLLDDKDYSVRQKLINDFEIAFLKQYTPLVGCEELESENKSTECRNHLKQAKNEFKQQFIKTRGLPKNTFEEIKLSFAN